MTPRIPEIEIADDADAAGIRREHHKSDAIDAVQRHRMRAELVIEPLMGAFTEQIQIEVRQHRWKAVGVLKFDDVIAKTGAQLVALGAIRQGASEKSGVMNAHELRRFAVFVDRVDIGRLGKKGTHNRSVILGVKAEIMKWIRMPAFDDSVGLCG